MKELKITKHVVERMIDRFPAHLSEEARQEALSGNFIPAKEEIRQMLSKAREDRNLASNPYLLARGKKAGRDPLTYFVYEEMAFAVGCHPVDGAPTVTTVVRASDYTHLPGVIPDLSDNPLAQALIKAGLSP